MRRSLGIVAGSILEAEYKGRTLILTPRVPVRRPTDALWAMAAGVVEENPKKAAREAIAKQKSWEDKH